MKKFYLPGILTICFVIFTVLLKFIDVQAIGPEGSLIGFATINGAVHAFFGEMPFWYKITQLLGVVAIAVAGAFAVIGFIQLIKRKSLIQVDRYILALGVVYIVVIILYVLFEKLAINYRPIISDEGLEASYPSTHTMLILTILGTARFAIRRLITNTKIEKILEIVLLCLMIITVVGRLICGVHWFTDIIGGILISSALVSFYRNAIM